MPTTKKTGDPGFTEGDLVTPIICRNEEREMAVAGMTTIKPLRKTKDSSSEPKERRISLYETSSKANRRTAEY